MSQQALMFANYSNPLIVVDAADFDGANDYMTRGAGLTSASDSQDGILSFWINTAMTGTTGYIASSSGTVGGNTVGSSLLASITTFDTIDIRCPNNVPSGNAFSVMSSATVNSGWTHVLCSWKLSTTTVNLYVNDAESLAGGGTINDQTCDYTVADWSVGAIPNGASKFDGCIAELYFAPGQYLDFSLVANRRKFISASGKPVHLGTTGALPTGTAPIVYQHLDDAEAVANFALNAGTGGDFSITGTLATCADSPSG